MQFLNQYCIQSLSLLLSRSANTSKMTIPSSPVLAVCPSFSLGNVIGMLLNKTGLRMSRQGPHLLLRRYFPLQQCNCPSNPTLLHSTAPPCPNSPTCTQGQHRVSGSAHSSPSSPALGGLTTFPRQAAQGFFSLPSSGHTVPDASLAPPVLFQDFLVNQANHPYNSSCEHMAMPVSSKFL